MESAIGKLWRHRVGLLLALASGVLFVLTALAAFAGSAFAKTPDRYIVVLKSGVAHPGAVAEAQAKRYGLALGVVYRHALDGYAAHVPGAHLGELRSDPRVDYVERDSAMKALATQTGATWGLDRIDQRSLPLSTTFSYSNSGAGVTAYIIDTGIRFTHNEFGARAVSGYDAVDPGTPADDCNGHGTHVAGTTGGTTYGVAKEVKLVAVRVLDCSGSGYTSGVIQGIDWATADHAAGQPAVANMSLGGGASSALDTAVKNSIADGISYAVAAGNGNRAGVAQNACKSSPSRVAEAMTIGATDRSDRKASWSNYGSCVDWFAPGVSITSAWYASDTATNTISGTSMATPHTTGVAALYLQSNPTASPQAVRDALFASTTKGIVSSSKTANNHLLFTNW
jgi:subtilisin family serine protease